MKIDATFRIDCALNIEGEGSIFLLPIFKNKVGERTYIQICSNGTILGFRETKVAGVSVISVNHRHEFRIGDEQAIVFRRSGGDTFCATRSVAIQKIKSERLIDTISDPYRLVQIADLVGDQHLLNSNRRKLSSGLLSSETYKNSIARETGWREIERQLERDGELLQKFMSQKACYDFRFGENGNVISEIYTDDPIDFGVVETARQAVSSLVDEIYYREPRSDTYQMDLPFRELVDGDYRNIRKFRRQETRLAVLFRYIIENPSIALEVLDAYGDHARYATRMITLFRENIRTHPPKSPLEMQHAVAAHLSVFYNQAHYGSRGVMLREFAKYLSVYDVILQALSGRLNDSQSAEVLKYEDQIQRYLVRDSRQGSLF